MTLAVVSVSGGKDSSATAILAHRSGQPCRYVFADTGNEHEETVAYVVEYMPRMLGQPVEVVREDFTARIEGKRRYIEEVWPTKEVPESACRRALGILRPTGVPFLDLCLWKGRFPSRKAQFCTQELKRRPLDRLLLELLAAGERVESWRGIRRDESAARANAQAREIAAEGWEVVHPIVEWTAQQTVDFVLSCGWELNPLYRNGMHRVGCMPCINCRKDELLEIAKRYPEHLDRIREWEALVSEASKRGWTTFFTDSVEDDQTDEQILEALRIDQRVEWAKTARGGRQRDFLREAPPASCSSAYGLCE